MSTPLPAKRSRDAEDGHFCDRPLKKASLSVPLGAARMPARCVILSHYLTHNLTHNSALSASCLLTLEQSLPPHATADTR